LGLLKVFIVALYNNKVTLAPASKPKTGRVTIRGGSDIGTQLKLANTKTR
jgi:hypothetical protein